MHVLRPGDGLFETVKVDDGRPFALSRHLDRLAASAERSGMPVDVAELRSAVRAASRGLEGPARLRLTVTLDADGDPRTTVVSAPRAPASVSAHVVTSPWRRNQHSPWTGHKATAYVDDVLALAEARDRGADEAVLADLDGRLSEGTTSNVFYVVDGEVRTPALATGCLPGVSRALVLEWFGVTEVAEPIDVALHADEVFLTSTTRDVQPVTRWDDRPLPPGSVTAEVARVWAEREPHLYD